MTVEHENLDDPATEALLREQLALIGGMLADDSDGDSHSDSHSTGADPDPHPHPHKPSRKRARFVAASVLGLAAAALIALLVVPPSADEEQAKPTTEGLVACARLIAEGTVSRVERADGDAVRVVLAVERRLKPAEGGSEEEFLVPRAEKQSFAVGTRMLVNVSRFPEEPVLEFTGTDIAPTWEWMSAAHHPGDTGCEGPA
ncbi:hypothetical protein ACIO3O_20085 [Streptomyces sp. NPDC087440]|uniref:hypothetical protein n=1 Tax=Streptomyces sp. NPDC087440 TaxID=3365790 RepID=UPI003808FF1D